MSRSKGNSTIKKVVLISMGLTLAYNVRNFLNKDQDPKLDSEQLEDLRLQIKQIKEITDILNDLNTKGLFHAIKQCMPKNDFDNFIKKLPLQELMSQDESSSILNSVAFISFKLWETKYSPTEIKAIGGPSDEQLVRDMALKHIANNPEIYKTLLEGDTPVIKVNKAYFSPNTYYVDYDKLDQIVRNDAENKLQGSMSLDDFTYVERLNISEQVERKVEALTSRASDFKEDLAELNKYYHDSEANKHLVEQIYGTETHD